MGKRRKRRQAYVPNEGRYNIRVWQRHRSNQVRVGAYIGRCADATDENIAESQTTRRTIRANFEFIHTDQPITVHVEHTMWIFDHQQVSEIGFTERFRVDIPLGYLINVTVLAHTLKTGVLDFYEVPDLDDPLEVPQPLSQVGLWEYPVGSLFDDGGQTRAWADERGPPPSEAWGLACTPPAEEPVEPVLDTVMLPSGAFNNQLEEDMFIGDPRRDAQFVRMDRIEQQFSNPATGKGVRWHVRSDGMVYPDLLELSAEDVQLPLMAGTRVAFGGHMSPLAETGYPRVMFRCIGKFWCTDVNASMRFMVGIGPEQPTDGAPGDPLNRHRVIDIAQGQMMVVDRLLAIHPEALALGESIAGQTLVFAIGAENVGVEDTNIRVHGVLSVQRLVGAGPQLLDRRIT